MSSNGLADRFIQLYNELSHLLQEKVGATHYLPFYELVQRAAKDDALIRKWNGRLRTIGDLRNIIVHHRDYPREVVAQPNEKLVDEFARFVEEVKAPTRLLPTFQRDLRIFSPDEPLREALNFMRHHDYSQVVVEYQHRFRLMTTEGVARWLEEQVVHDLISLEEARIEDVLPFDSDDAAVALGREHTIYDAHMAFAEAIDQGLPRLFAILITERGSLIEKPIGIVTPWDLIGSQHV